MAARSTALAVDGQPPGAGHVVERRGPRASKAGPRASARLAVPRLSTVPMPIGDAGGEAAVGGAQAGAEQEHGAQREARLGDDGICQPSPR